MDLEFPIGVCVEVEIVFLQDGSMLIYSTVYF